MGNHAYFIRAAGQGGTDLEEYKQMADQVIFSVDPSVWLDREDRSLKHKLTLFPSYLYEHVFHVYYSAFRRLNSHFDDLGPDHVSRPEFLSYARTLVESMQDWAEEWGNEQMNRRLKECTQVYQAMIGGKPEEKGIHPMLREIMENDERVRKDIADIFKNGADPNPACYTENAMRLEEVYQAYFHAFTERNPGIEAQRRDFIAYARELLGRMQRIPAFFDGETTDYRERIEDMVKWNTDLGGSNHDPQETPGVSDAERDALLAEYHALRQKQPPHDGFNRSIGRIPQPLVSPRSSRLKKDGFSLENLMPYLQPDTFKNSIDLLVENPGSLGPYTTQAKPGVN
ncbi:MAG: hypothetical protein V1735_00745 [Nanoarchaeota archaeon]